MVGSGDIAWSNAVNKVTVLKQIDSLNLEGGGVIGRYTHM